MKRLMLATVASAALLTGMGAASAQTFYSDGPYYGGGPFVEHGVGLQIGPVGVGIYDNGPAYYDGGWYHGWRSRAFRGDSSHSTYNMRAFRSQEIWPQSPPGGS